MSIKKKTKTKNIKCQIWSASKSELINGINKVNFLTQEKLRNMIAMMKKRKFFNLNM